MTPYALTIRDTLAHAGHLGTEPRHVEAWMRCEHGTLDALSPARFQAEAIACAELARQAGAAMSETLAATLGL